MKKTILRNVAIVTAIFIVTLSVMLITNFFQVRGTTPLQAEVVETLKQLNDANSNNPELQEQIRQLDLMTRKAYFIRYDHLMAGLYILLGMLAVFIVCVRLYFARDKNIPDKELDPIDEWAIKTQARKYVTWGAAGIAAIALLFVILTSPYLQTEASEADEPEVVADAVTDTYTSEPVVAGDELVVATEPAVVSSEGTGENAETAVVAQPETVIQQPIVSSVTHNAFRGNNSNGISSARGVPVKWDLSNGTNIAWKQEVPREGLNSPVINGNRIFFSGADAEARELYCYDLTTGERLWTLAATNIPGSPSQMPETQHGTGLAASSVATNGTQVCAIFATGDIICADMNGNRLWAKNLGVPDNHYGYASSLLTYGNTVIVQYDNSTAPRVMAFDLATGNERWSRNRTERVTWSSPIIATVNNTPQLVLMGNPSISGYNPNTGEQLWRVECLTGEVGASACSANGIVFGASEYSKLVAINAADGSLLWESNEYLPEASSPVATNTTLYVATSYGVLASYDVQTGELKKEHELAAELWSSPMIVDGKLFMMTNDGKMHIYSADDEFRLIDSFETGERTLSTPAFTDGKIVIRTENSIYCVTAS
ncbi:PQQ-binding-like beta-propeller repeat protein [Parabacteroides sp. OttesenSCG-928-G07]|nr:PQQ-binding-like beta-propeller repeat protein [Parabacteroides sp. OttesenSCG-928-G21]MDL2278015.1 PQQ-binding-like beta-propeller repeat protein [Parabacteroides sp. OttesenSCG-928-G07]